MINRLISILRSFGELAMGVGVWTVVSHLLGSPPLSTIEAIILTAIGLLVYICADIWGNIRRHRQ